MSKVSIGDIRVVSGSTQLALVIFVREHIPGRSDDVRVVPLYRGAADMGTDRDLIIPPDANPFHEPLLAACWNARGLAGADLAECVGRVDTRVVDAARIAEMAGIIPDLDTTKCLGWLGTAPVSEEMLERAKAFQLAEAKAWDALEENLWSQRDNAGWVLTRKTYITSQLARGKVVDFAPDAKDFAFTLETGTNQGQFEPAFAKASKHVVLTYILDESAVARLPVPFPLVAAA